MILSSIYLKNFLSHSNTEIKFYSNQKLLILGKSGAGKSSIIEALLWCLFNRGRVNSRSLIKNGKKTAEVIINLIDKNKKYQIKRIISSTGKHNFSVLEKVKNIFIPIKADGIRNVQDYLEQNILHSSYTLFINSIIFPQNNVNSFVNQDTIKRKELLLEIINADKYDEYYEKIKEELSKLQIQKSENKIKIDNLQELIAENKKASSKLSTLEKENTEIIIKIKELEKKLFEIKDEQTKAKIANAELLEKINQIEELDNQIDQIDKELKQFQSDFMIVNEEKTKLNKIIKEEKNNNDKGKLLILKEHEKKANKWNIKMLEIVKQKPVEKIFDNENKDINQKIILLIGEKTENCPELNKPCPVIIKERNKKIKDLEEKLIHNDKEKKEYLQTLEEYEKKENKIGECPKVYLKEIERLETKIENQKKVKEQLKEISVNNSYLKSNIFDKEKELLELKNKETKIKKEVSKLIFLENKNKLYSDEIFCKQELGEVKMNYDDNIELLSLAKNAKIEIEKNEDKIKILKKEKKELDTKIESFELLKNAFSNNGLKTIVIDQVIPMLEDKINKVLKKLSDFKIHLDTQKKGIDTTLEGLFITIYNELGEELDIESFSGGEKMRITYAIFEGLASFQKCNFRILDETISNLDDEMETNFIDIILKLKKDIDQLICISHIQNIQDVFEEKINIVKINGNSQIQQ